MNYGSLSISGKILSFGRHTVKLSSLQLAFVMALAQESGTILSKEKLLEMVYGPNGTYKQIDFKHWKKSKGYGLPEPKIVDVNICNIRNKMQRASGEASPIGTVWGQGYYLPKATRKAA